MAEKPKFKLDKNSFITVDLYTKNGVKRLEGVVDYDYDKNGNFVGIDEDGLVRYIVTNPDTILISFIPYTPEYVNDEHEEHEEKSNYSYDTDDGAFQVPIETFADFSDDELIEDKKEALIKKFKTDNIKY